MNSKSPIVFVADYPLGDKIKDGMSQRIIAVDDEFNNIERIYLSISFRNFKKKKVIKDGKLTIIYLNFFRHQLTIRNILRNAKTVYMHSVYNSLRVIFHRDLLKNRCAILDAHGVVPEECEFSKQRLKQHIFSVVERIIFKTLDYVIVVSNEMSSHFKKKYANGDGIKYILKPIYSINVVESSKIAEKQETEDINIIYSGNLQAWQNIDLMAETISRMDNPKYNFIILTQFPEIMEQRLGDLMNTRKIIIKSVFPEELGHYYNQCEYGFVLRDETLLNKVSAPTKMIEYLSFGITPIVLSPHIGDWLKLGYEYITIQSEKLNHLDKHKSKRNQQIALSAISQNKNTNLLEISHLD